MELESEEERQAAALMREWAQHSDIEGFINSNYDRLDRAHIRGNAKLCVKVREVAADYNSTSESGHRLKDDVAKRLLARIGIWDMDNPRVTQKIGGERNVVLLLKKAPLGSEGMECNGLEGRSQPSASGMRPFSTPEKRHLAGGAVAVWTAAR
eukprot:jgi/Tetstr1/433413/TSEL_022687.t1